MALVAESQIRAKIVEKIQAAAPAAKVYSRWRRPLSGRMEDYVSLLVDPATDRIHVWMVRRVQRIPVVNEGFKDRISITQVYAILGHYSYLDTDEPGVTPSEDIFQLEIDTLAEAFETSVDLGLGNGIHHRGFVVPTDFDDTQLGDSFCHTAIARLTVDNEDC